MAKSVLAVRVDNQTKIKAQQLARDAGLSLSHLVDLQLKKMVAQGRVDDDVSANLNPQFEKRLEKIDADIKAGRKLEGPFKTTADLSRALDLSDDD